MLLPMQPSIEEEVPCFRRRLRCAALAQVMDSTVEPSSAEVCCGAAQGHECARLGH